MDDEQITDAITLAFYDYERVAHRIVALVYETFKSPEVLNNIDRLMLVTEAVSSLLSNTIYARKRMMAALKGQDFDHLD